MSRFVIVVDMQHDFVMPGGALPVPGAADLIEPLEDWLSGLDAVETAGILMTFDTHDPVIYAASTESGEFPIHCVRGAAGWESVLNPSRINPAIPLYRMEKGVFDMWAEPDIAIEDARAPGAKHIARDTLFEGLKRQGVETIIVVGVAADYCVRWAVDGLVAREFKVEIPRAFTRGIHRQVAQVVQDFDAAEVRLVTA